MKLIREKISEGQRNWLFLHEVITKQEYDSWYRNPVSDVRSTGLVPYEIIQKEVSKFGNSLNGNLSDMLQGATNSKIQCGIGHQASYWENASKLPVEAFAEMFDSTMSNVAQLDILKTYLPKSYDTFVQMMKELAEDG